MTDNISIKDRLDPRQLSLWAVALLIFLAALGLWVLLGERGVEKIEGMFEKSENQAPVSTSPRGQIVAQQLAFNNAADAIKPAVASICSYANSASGNPNKSGHSWKGLGSGVIVSPQGYIVTTNEIVNQAQDIKVTRFEKGHTHIYHGEVVTTFPMYDLAVLKVTSNKPLPSSMLGDSSRTMLGGWALAVGSPLGMKQMMVSGLISSIDRRRGFRTSMATGEGFIGGPLISNGGEIIGIVTTNGYAVSSNVVRKLLEGIGIPHLTNLNATGGL
ncbi:S1C family serine protease [Elusimicrobiota bacterium]